MTMLNFIKEYKEHIDSIIKDSNGKDIRINNEERRLWVLNTEGLYYLARNKGVRI